MFSWLEARTHCHATEDKDKVSIALELLCAHSKMVVTKTDGYNKNPILVLTAKTDSARAIRDFWRLLRSQGIVDEVLGLGEKMIDEEWVLHLRFGKQDAFMGKAALVDHDDAVSVRLKIPRQPPRNRNAFEVAKEIIEELTKDHVSHA